MVNLITGPRGSGKTQQMIDLANEKVKTSSGNVVFIDSILKQANITLESLPTFIEKLNKISEDAKIDFYLSVSADKAEIADVDTLGCTVL